MARTLHLVVLHALLTAAPARAQEAPASVPHGAALEVRSTPDLRRVRDAAHRKGRLLGYLAQDAAFYVWERSEPSEGCDEGWGRVAPDRQAWSCLDGTEPTDATPAVLPVPFPFDPPLPEEDADYLATGTWPRAALMEGEGLLPFVYLKRRRDWRGPIYPSVDALRAGVGGKEHPSDHDLAFSAILADEGGEIVVAPDGRAARLRSLYAYPASRFQGLDLAVTPLPEGRIPAFAIARTPLPVFATPTTDTEPVGVIAYHEALWIDRSAEAPRGWLKVEDPHGVRPSGYTRDSASIRRWQDADPPPRVEGELWIDIDLAQQMIAVRRGAAMEYVTLVSTGKDGHETVTGVFPMIDKAAWWDMRSLPGSADPYVVEAVPWTMHFWPRYALHGAYWHDVFGRVVSHGCVNLAPKDAAWIFARVEPHLHEGWQLAYADADEPGTALRVRRGSAPVKDRRREPAPAPPPTMPTPTPP